MYRNRNDIFLHLLPFASLSRSDIEILARGNARKFFNAIHLILYESFVKFCTLQLKFAQYPRQGAIKQATLQMGNLPMAPCEILESYCYAHEKSIDAIMHLFLVPPAPMKRKTHVAES